MKTVILAVLLLFVVASLVSGAPPESEHLPETRISCNNIISGLVGNALCNAHCKVLGKSKGTCRNGTCYCS